MSDPDAIRALLIECRDEIESMDQALENEFGVGAWKPHPLLAKIDAILDDNEQRGPA